MVKSGFRNGLYEEVTWLHAKWKQYRILFAESPERIDLLNEIAGFFFQVIQDVLWEDVALRVTRCSINAVLPIRPAPAPIDRVAAERALPSYGLAQGQR